MNNFSSLLLLSFVFFCSRFCFSRDSITSTSFIKDPSTIFSNASKFELGFFNPIDSTSRYVGIWFNIVSNPVVWVANRDRPLKDNSGVFTIANDGNIVVLDGHNQILWSSNVSNPPIDTSARILDSGNLVLEDSTGEVVWESFKHPCNTFLPKMKFITNKRTGEKVELTSWKSLSDPSPGNFSLSLDVLSVPEVVIWNGCGRYWRTGQWNGQYFISIRDLQSIYLSGFNLMIQDQIYSLSFVNVDETTQFYYSLNSQGNLLHHYWDSAENEWKVIWKAIETGCDFYGACGAFGICNEQTTPICSCLRGFEPKNMEGWNRGNWTDGCVRKTPLQCEKLNNISTEQGRQDGFFNVEMVKLPHFGEWFNSYRSADDCRTMCLDNCLCTAYAYENGIGCMFWNGNLTDIQKLGRDGEIRRDGGVLYLRLANTEFDDVKNNKGIIIASVISGTLICITAICILWKCIVGKHGEKRRRRAMLFANKNGKFLELTKEYMIRGDLNQVNQELPLFYFEELENATNHFHSSNKLGEGGFGPVYKGSLLDGREIAVKRLSKASNQGLEEFTTEVMVISKLQHRNLVRLLGCCVEGEEKMLIYEYMPNQSLDALIFDSPKQQLLDWEKRFNIIDGIARGLLYLHRDSRLKIIHRDLKTSNILLDKNLNPKISDFGMARIFGGNEVQANTLRVVGTYGYMSPEYAMQGRFSEKSNVFSFGVILLEIISGRRNTSFYDHEDVISLLGFVGLHHLN